MARSADGLAKKLSSDAHILRLTALPHHAKSLGQAYPFAGSSQNRLS